LKKRIIHTLIFCFSFNVALYSQNISHLSHKACNLCISGDHNNESPYHISLKKEIPYFAVSAGLLGTGLILRNSDKGAPFTINELNGLDGNSINFFDRGAIFNNSATAATLSDIGLFSGLILPSIFLSNHHTRNDFIPLTIIGLEVFSVTSSLTLNAKFLFNRARPLTFNDNFSNEERTNESSQLSFFSGHTAQSAALSVFIAKVITDYHPNIKKGHKIGLWSFALTLPAVTGFLRVQAGKHFNSDVITGYAIGSAIGFLIPHLHKRKKDAKFSMSLFNGGNANGLSLKWKL